MQRILLIAAAFFLLMTLTIWANKTEAQSNGVRTVKSVYKPYIGSERRLGRRIRVRVQKSPIKTYRGRLRATRFRNNVSILKPDEKDILIAKLQKEIRQLKLKIRLLQNIKLRKSK